MSSISEVEFAAAKLSNYVYFSDPSLLPLDTKHIEFESLGITLPIKSHSYLFEWKGKTWFFVNRGTSSGEDWAHNLLQLNGDSSDFLNTASVAYKVFQIAAEKNIELIFCGHSKGGTHASLHGYITSCQAITFNSPGPSPKTLELALNQLAITNVNLSHNNTVSFMTDSDFLTNTSQFLNYNRNAICFLGSYFTQEEYFPENFVFTDPVGRKVILNTEGIFPILKNSYLSYQNTQGGFWSGLSTGFNTLTTNVVEKHSMSYMLTCMNEMAQNSQGS